MILDKVKNVHSLRQLRPDELDALAKDIRQEIIRATSCVGGHLAPSLGVVELTIALHYAYDTPADRIIWDVGHQSYAHKILTGRRKDFCRLRSCGGISGFPRRCESEFDPFGTGHSSTSISAALGMACARDLTGGEHRVAAVIGDGAMTGGMAFEGLNNAGHLKSDILVILNDNEMFISGAVGAFRDYLTRVLSWKPVHRIEERAKNLLQKYPRGKDIMKLIRRSRAMLTPGMFFEELGFEYFGPVDGHDTRGLVDILGNIRNINGPKLLHVVTRKGKGYPPAEESPETFHGTSPFKPETGAAVCGPERKKSCQDVFGEIITELASEDRRVAAITAAMKSGTGLKEFADRFPERFFDVGIAEQHAVTFAAGLAADGIRPVCAIYSTFLQRAYDQIIHDVALQRLPVIFAVDRAGIVGEDGPTHHGVFDLSYLSTIPDMTVAAPSTRQEMKNLFRSALEWSSPAAIRYPRGSLPEGSGESESSVIKPGTGVLLREGKDLIILAIGNMVHPALEAAGILARRGIEAGVADLRFAKPLDRELILSASSSAGRVLTVEENVLSGGVGERIAAILPRGIMVDMLGIPDRFITFGAPDELRGNLGLTAEGISSKAEALVSSGGP